MKQRTQHYFMIVSDPENCRIGQMVYVDDSTIRGFIREANSITGVCEVVFFEPLEVEFTEGMIQIAEVEPNWYSIFREVLTQVSPSVRRIWEDACKLL